MNDINNRIDFSFILLFSFVFIVLIFAIFNINSENKISIFVMLFMLFFVIMVTYLTNYAIGLILSSVIVFVYSTYMIYHNIAYASEFNLISYIWIACIPIASVLSGTVNKYVQEIQSRNNMLNKQNKELVSIDSQTGLRNIKMFHNDLNVEMSKSRRYKSDLTLILIQLQHYQDLKRIIGNENIVKLKNHIKNSVVRNTRVEDIRYSIDKEMLAIIMPNTNLEGANIVKERVKKELRELNLDLINGSRYIDIDIKIACTQYKQNIKDSIMFKDIAIEELQYDV